MPGSGLHGPTAPALPAPSLLLPPPPPAQPIITVSLVVNALYLIAISLRCCLWEAGLGLIHPGRETGDGKTLELRLSQIWQAE